MIGFDLPQPYLLFIGDEQDFKFAKTAWGLRDWAPERCVGECGLGESPASVGLPIMSPAAAALAGVRAMVLGVAAPGGAIPVKWLPLLIAALEAGLDLISGAHVALDSVPALREAAARHGRQLIDVRRPRQPFEIARGIKRTGKRLLTVGTDCQLGKKYTALALARAFRRRGVAADFRATGQTGIMIAGGGVAIDAVVADFIAGAAEALSPAAAADHWDVVEGQGSLFHPAYAGVSLGLLHGTQPDVIVLCHNPARTRVNGFEDFAMPDVAEAIDLNLALGRRTNPAIRCAGISLNTADLSVPDAERMLATMSQSFGLPCADPMRGGKAFEALVAACLG